MANKKKSPVSKQKAALDKQVSLLNAAKARLAAAIATLLSDPARRAELGRAAHARRAPGARPREQAPATELPPDGRARG